MCACSFMQDSLRAVFTICVQRFYSYGQLSKAELEPEKDWMLELAPNAPSLEGCLANYFMAEDLGHTCDCCQDPVHRLTCFRIVRLPHTMLLSLNRGQVSCSCQVQRYKIFRHHVLRINPKRLLKTCTWLDNDSVPLPCFTNVCLCAAACFALTHLHSASPMYPLCLCRRDHVAVVVCCACTQTMVVSGLLLSIAEAVAM